MIPLKESAATQIFCGHRRCQKILDWESSVLLQVQFLLNPSTSRVICGSCWTSLGEAAQLDASNRCVRITIGPKVDRGAV